MNNYKEIRIISAESLRTVCIKYNWFTKGNNEQYAKFLKLADVPNVTTKRIAKMAEMVKQYSNTDMDIECIMFYLNREMGTTFERTE